LAYYQAFDVFVMSSVTEQMPMALLEAMACGLPAVCTDVGDTAQMLDTAAAPSLVPSSNLEAYTEALRAAAARPDWRMLAGTSNRARCVEHYSLDRMVQEYSALYRSAVASFKAPTAAQTGCAVR
jgi:glycosyltransferase involved in cell wall biosynthesis